jgi:hypothetical protein
LLHLLTTGIGTTRTIANAGACPQLVEADIRLSEAASGFDPQRTCGTGYSITSSASSRKEFRDRETERLRGDQINAQLKLDRRLRRQRWLRDRAA